MKRPPITKEIHLEVEFRYCPGHPGTWYRRNGDPGDPPEPDEVDVVSVRWMGVDLTEQLAKFLSENDTFREMATEEYIAAILDAGKP